MSEILDEMSAIGEVVNWYFNAMYQSDGSLILKAFDEKARVVGLTDGKLQEMSVPRFAEFVAQQQPSAAASEEPFDMRIVTIDVSGGSAMVKVADRYLDRDFIDYLSLIKVDGQWRIFNKLWHT